MAAATFILAIAGTNGGVKVDVDHLCVSDAHN